jgi:hypothetical protein
MAGASTGEKPMTATEIDTEKRKFHRILKTVTIAVKNWATP